MAKNHKKQDRYVNKKTLSFLWNKDERQITRFMEEGLPYERGGRANKELIFDIAECTNWRIEREVSKKNGKIDQYKIREAKSRSEKLEIEVELLKGSVVPVDNMEDYLLPIFHNFRSKMLALPHSAAPNISAMKNPIEIEDYLRNKIHEALNELGRYDRIELVNKNNTKRYKIGSKTAKEPNSDGMGG